MTDNTSRLFNHVSTTHDFLLAKTDVSCPPGTASPESDSSTTPDTPSEILLKAFPDLATGKRFMEQAMDALAEIDLFCACAVRISTVQKSPGNSELPQSTLAVAGAVDTACRQGNGLWGMIDQDLFGCFFPEKGDDFCNKAVDLIRTSLPESAGPSVTIGTAVYPTLSFSRDRILENACKAVDHACFFGPDSTMAFDDVSLNISGDKLFQSGDIHTAVDEFKAALALNEKSINVRNSLGVCYALLNKLDLAKQEFLTALDLDEGETMALYNLGLIHLLSEEREKALGYFQEADRLDPDIFEVTFHIGRLLLDMEDTDGCIPYLNRSLALAPTSAEAHRALGDYYVARDELTEAVAAYKKSIKLNPNGAAALSALGTVYDLRDENTEIATLYCEKSVQLSPNEGLFHLRLGNLYLKQDRVDEAQLAFKSAADLGQNTPIPLEDAPPALKTG